MQVWDYFWALYSIPLIYVSVFSPILHCFDIMALQYSLESECLTPPTLLIFLRIALAICRLLWFHTNFRIGCPSTVKNDIGIMIEIALNL